ncbi:MAG: hypothetical protein D4R68_03305 [Ignavibacteriales bacterium]|nr:MAG: hypothetical protein D4R68_03305 [Ignavibacteriales bacterium]
MMTFWEMTSSMKMKTFLYNLIVLFLFCNLFFAQSKTDSLKNHETTLNFSNYFYNQTLYTFNFDDLSSLKFSPGFLNDSSSIWIQTRMQLARIINQDEILNNFQMNILNPLSEKYADVQSLKEWKYILGAVQLSAVGYLAYLHLKKYGFLKK